MQTRPVAEISTRPASSQPDGGTTWHVYPVDYEGKKEQPLIKLNHNNTPIL